MENFHEWNEAPIPAPLQPLADTQLLHRAVSRDPSVLQELYFGDHFGLQWVMKSHSTNGNQLLSGEICSSETLSLKCFLMLIPYNTSPPPNCSPTQPSLCWDLQVTGIRKFCLWSSAKHHLHDRFVIIMVEMYLSVFSLLRLALETNLLVLWQFSPWYCCNLKGFTRFC